MKMDSGWLFHRCPARLPSLTLPAILFSAKDDQDPVSLQFASFPREVVFSFFAFLFRLKSGNHLRGCEWSGFCGD